MGTATGIWREPVAYPVRSLIHVTQQIGVEWYSAVEFCA
jgi:hypothetical protein